MESALISFADLSVYPLIQEDLLTNAQFLRFQRLGAVQLVMAGMAPCFAAKLAEMAVRARMLLCVLLVVMVRLINKFHSGKRFETTCAQWLLTFHRVLPEAKRSVVASHS